MTSRHDDDQPRDDQPRDEHGRRSGVSATGPEVRATLMGNGTPMGPDAVSSLESAIRSAHSKAGVDHSGATDHGLAHAVMHRRSAPR